MPQSPDSTPLRPIALAFALLVAVTAPAAATVEAIDRPDTGSVSGGGYRDDDAGDVVDFAQKPQSGTVIDVEDRLECRVRGTIRYEGDEEPRQVDKRADGEARLRVTFERVDPQAGVRRVVVDHRRYRMTITQYDATGEATKSPPVVHPLENHTVRGTWGDAPADVRIEVADEEGWRPATDDQRRALRTGRLRDPLLPMPSSIKRVGESWSLTQPQLDDVFGDHFGRVASVGVSGRSRLTLTRIRRVGQRRIADIALDFDVRLSIPGHPTSRLRLSGTARYDATRGFVSAVDMRGTTTTKGRLEANGQIVTLDVASEMRIESRAAIATPVAIPTEDR